MFFLAVVVVVVVVVVAVCLTRKEGEEANTRTFALAKL